MAGVASGWTAGAGPSFRPQMEAPKSPTLEFPKKGIYIYVDLVL